MLLSRRTVPCRAITTLEILDIVSYDRTTGSTKRLPIGKGIATCEWVSHMERIQQDDYYIPQSRSVAFHSLKSGTAAQ